MEKNRRGKNKTANVSLQHERKGGVPSENMLGRKNSRSKSSKRDRTPETRRREEYIDLVEFDSIKGDLVIGSLIRLKRKFIGI